MCETISTWNVTVSDENNLDCEDFCQVTDNILKFITRVKNTTYAVRKGTRMKIVKSLCGGTMEAA